MQEALNDVVLGIIGSGGDGVMAAGSFLVKSAAKAGKYGFMHKSFGAQIRGGESSALIRIADHKVMSQGKYVNILLVYNLGIYEMFQKEFIREVIIEKIPIMFLGLVKKLRQTSLLFLAMFQTQSFKHPLQTLTI